MTVRNKGPKTQRTNGNLGRRLPNKDGVALFVMNGVAVNDITLGTLYNIQDMNALGIDAAYDSTNEVLVHYHLSRALLYNPNLEGYFFLCPKKVSTVDTTPTIMCDKANPYVAKALSDAKTAGVKVKLLGVAYNPDAAYTPTITAGIDATAATAKAKLKELLDLQADDYQFMHAFLEARSFSGTISALSSVEALSSNLKAPRISFVIASELDIAGVGSTEEGFAAIGAAIGMWSLAAISENPGNPINKFNLTNTANGAFLKPGLSGNVPLPTDAALLNTLAEKGYIFAENVAEIDGIYFNDARTATTLDDDYAYIENNRVMDKVQLIVKRTATPLTTNARLQVDQSSGELSITQKSLIEDTCADALGVLLRDGDISGGISCVIPAGINVLAGETIYIDTTVVPMAIGREVTVRSGFSNPFK